MRDNHRFKVLVWHRRARKTTTAINEIAKQAHLKKAVYWHIFPTYSEAHEAVWKDPQMLFRVIPRDLIARTNENELTLYLKCGSIICLKGADKPERLLGAGPFGVVLDEFAEMKYDTWERIVQPIIRANGGWTWFIGTPRGKNHLFRLYLKGQEEDPEWRSWLLKASESGIVSDSQLDLARRDMSDSLYRQEFECDFLEGEGSVFRGVREVAVEQPNSAIANHLYVMGVDLAKVQDYTVIVVYDRNNNQQVYQDRFKTIEWPFQKKRIRAIARAYNNALISIDATGVGDPIADDLLRSGLSVEPFKITSQNKKELVEKLSIAIEQKQIKMLRINETLLEFDNFSYQIGVTGHITYGAPEGYNDDIVIAHALAVWSLQPVIKEPKDREPGLIRKKYLQDTGRWDEDESIEEDEYEREWEEN